MDADRVVDCQDFLLSEPPWSHTLCIILVLYLGWHDQSGFQVIIVAQCPLSRKFKAISALR